jgi:two-component system, LuxR family, sensor kinase FixL
MLRKVQNVLSAFIRPKRRHLLALAVALTVAIALVDWLTKPYVSLGILYLGPIILIGGVLSRTQIIGAALICAVLQESFSNLPENEAIFRLAISSVGFIATGLFVSELLNNRRVVLQHLERLEDEIRLRRDAEHQLQILIESSPAAIVTIDATDRILLANNAAQQLFAPGGASLKGETIHQFLPALKTLLKSQPAVSFRTSLQCRGHRISGEIFLAAVWFSTYRTVSGPRLAAVIVDLSEDLRSREDLSLNHLLKSSRILVGAMAHEIRNLSGAALALQRNLSHVPGLENNEDFLALSSLIQSLGKISTLSVAASPSLVAETVEATSLLDESRILIDGACHDSGVEVEWETQESLPMLRADHYGLIQVFLNLAKNSQRAMESSSTRKLRVSASSENGRVVVRFQDTGTGVLHPEELFRPFQLSASTTGLGLYISRSIMRSFGGDLVYEPRTQGSCFAVIIPAANGREPNSHV